MTDNARDIDADPILVHDYLLVMRGGERTFATLCDLWPGAPVATLLYDRSVFAQRLGGHPVRTSPLQRLRLRQSSFKVALPLMPAATRMLDLSGHRLVLSSSSAFAHGDEVDPGATHVCYRFRSTRPSPASASSACRARPISARRSARRRARA